MDKILFYQNVCHSLAKATGSGVRLFINDVCVYYYSIFHIHPGPAIPFLPELLSKKNIAGVITTPLYQFYGYLTTDEGYRIIIGPSRIEKNDGRLINEQLFILGVPSDEKNNYVHLLECCPKVSAERMGWIITFLSNVTNHSPLSIDELYVNIKAEEFKKDLNKDITNKTENLSNETSSTQELKYNAYQFEKLVISYIKNGEAEELRDFFSAIPNYLAGNMSEDGLRQLKDMGICGATVASRAAISGGLDYATAFLMSDLYIQKIEMLKEERSLDVLRNEMMIDFVEAVRKIRYRIKENNIKM